MLLHRELYFNTSIMVTNKLFVVETLNIILLYIPLYFRRLIIIRNDLFRIRIQLK